MTVTLTARLADGLAAALRYHDGQLRKGTQIPYISHPIAVASLALEHGADEDVAIAALLHDAAEDSEDGEAALSEIAAAFGSRVAGMVRSCSDRIARPGVSKPEWRQRKRDYLEHLRTEADSDALLVSLCDKVHNLRSILADHAVEGDALWTRFSAPPDAQLGYYQQLSAIFSARLPGALADTCADLVRQLEAIV